MLLAQPHDHAIVKASIREREGRARFLRDDLTLQGSRAIDSAEAQTASPSLAVVPAQQAARSSAVAQEPMGSLTTPSVPYSGESSFTV